MFISGAWRDEARSQALLAGSESHRAYTNRMDDVGTWDPGAAATLGGRQVELIRKACRNLDCGDFGLTAGEQGELAPLMTAGADVWGRGSRRGGFGKN